MMMQTSLSLCKDCSTAPPSYVPTAEGIRESYRCGGNCNFQTTFECRHGLTNLLLRLKKTKNDRNPDFALLVYPDEHERVSLKSLRKTLKVKNITFANEAEKKMMGAKGNNCINMLTFATDNYDEGKTKIIIHPECLTTETATICIGCECATQHLLSTVKVSALIEELKQIRAVEIMEF